MKLRILTLSCAAVLSGCMCSCSSTLPPDTTFTGSSGKQTVGVSVGGLTWKDALGKVGIAVGKAAGQALADYATAQLRGRLELPAK